MTNSGSNHGPSVEWLFLTGPTASGKTAVAIPLARRFNAEIISLDSMAVYRGMDIGTAKPTRQERDLVPHHLIDVVDPDDEFSIAIYLRMAEEAARDIESRGKRVLFVGGTPLYLKALLRGIDEGPPADWEFRREVLEEARQVGVERLHQRLEQVDPLSAARLPPTDTRRIIRALEVHRATGVPISHGQLHFDEVAASPPMQVFALHWPRDILHARIHARVEAMFAAGWIEETRRLWSGTSSLGRTASQAVGYREIVAHLQGELDLATTIERVKARTRRYAKRQLTWFRGMEECHFVERNDEESPAEVAHRILEWKERGHGMISGL